MTAYRPARWRPPSPPAAGAVCLVAAGALRVASTALARLARRLVARRPAATAEPMLEFYAEAGAPEGALYLDGQLVGWVPGVRRL